MEIQLLGAFDYYKLRELLKTKGISEELIEEIEKLEIKQRSKIVSAAGRISRFPGDVFEALSISEANEFEKNVNYIKRVIAMGHDSITDHDYCVFAIKNVSPIIEQTIIAERFCSFTIKSRREVDFSNVGFYVPDFRNKKGKIISNNEVVKKEYKEYMDSLFNKYVYFVELGITKEDARFILPYSYNSNIIMGIDAHVLKDLIIKFTKTKYANIAEIKEFGEKLRKIAEKNIPYIIEQIDKIEKKEYDEVDKYLETLNCKNSYNIIDVPKMLDHSKKIDEIILVSSLMRRYQYDYNTALKILKKQNEVNDDFSNILMRKIAFESDALELTQVHFQFQIPISLAILTHLTRHRTHHILIPDFVPVIDLTQYKIPPKVKALCLDAYKDVFAKNKTMYEHFKNDYEICEEDLVYFTLSGNLVNVITNIDGKTLKHILKLRECTKAQWETRDMARGMHKEIDKIEGAKIFSSILGAPCETEFICKEGKECCGKINAILKSRKECGIQSVVN